MKEIYTANLIAQNNNGKILLVKRAFGNNESGLWSLPGGTKEKNEKIHDTLTREIKEEIGLNIKKYIHFKTYKIASNDKIVKAYYFTGIINKSIVLNKKELSEYKWFSLENIPNDLAYNQNIILNELFRKINKSIDNADRS
ncbi:MAG: NUDIX hydrolase [Candidatus Pacebacteria bacterium]|nr:NUDIX hydrolase [Candidatus Paceibacterota bacterium]